MTDEERADAIRKTTHAILEVLGRSGFQDDAAICMAALGGAAGSIAVVSGDPARAVGIMHSVAAGIVDGSLLDP